MTVRFPPRHLLVIAPQCADLGMLTGLEDLAGSLHTALLDPWTGGCADAPAGVTSILSGPSVGQARIEEAVRDAARRAGEAGAVLVLAFIGHGTLPGEVPKLFLMAGDSRRDMPTTVVNVGDLLSQALDTHGVEEVIALVDTCHAGAAVPDIAALGTGIRGGATRLTLLMSVGVTEPAFGLDFTRGLLRVFGAGVAGAGEYLSAEAVLDAVNEAADTGARLVHMDGDPYGRPRWLVRNVRHAQGGGPLLGPAGEEDLEWALEPFGGGWPPASVHSVSGLEKLREALRAAPPGCTDGPADVAVALRVVDGLLDGLRTAELLRSWPGAPLTSERIRRAAWTAGGTSVPLPGSNGSDLLRDCVELLRLRAPRTGGSRTAPLAAFVASLADEDGLDPHCDALTAWARTCGAVVEINDAFAALEEHDTSSRLRLVVSLHAALADEWPETLVAWLLDRGTVIAHREFGCAPSRAGVERQLVGVLKWASAEARRVGAALRRVEVAASSALLTQWSPEEADLGIRLGVRHDVVLRWSERLCPPDHLYWINDHARDRLATMRSEPDTRAPVDWLGRDETNRPAELNERLRNGVYDRAVALGHRPERLDQVMPSLLAYAPIVLWPKDKDDLPPDSRTSVNRYWHRLPGEFSAAYRDSWRGRGTEEGAAEGRFPLARLRSVWHDTEWLDFCDWFGTCSTDGENTV
ncbi:hypothetical protein [Streptomyces sp. NPDC088726]|uniref:vWA-MoxR associated conflict system protein n=1 Tax=Streptomyces sp. NPDC088726 TaxID=3365874 RepID=UPI003820BFDA